MHTLLSNLGNAYTYRFLKLSEDKDLEEAISFQKQAVSVLPEGHPDMPFLRMHLGRSYLTRYDFLKDSVSIDQALSNHQCAAESPTGSPSLRFEAARTWAELCSLHRGGLRLQAYRQLVTLIPELVWVGMTVRRRFKDIATIKGVVNQAAAAAIALREYNLAFEWLEEGRSIVWSQLLQLRTPLDDIRAANAALADQIEMVAYQLDQAGNTERAEISLLDTGLLDQARETPGCKGLLLPKTTVELAHAAQTRTIALVNVHEDRCDALALLPGSIDVVHIPLLELSYEKVVRIYSSFKKCLTRANVQQRGHRRPVYPDDEHTSNGDQLNLVLLDLWNNIVEPILSHLGYLRRSPDQLLPHLTWCPTGPLAFLPLHAAGRYDDHPARVYDYVISSYTPTVGALVNRKPRSGDFQGILAVGQSETVGLRPLPGTVTELAKIREIAGDNCQFTALDGEMATPTAVLDAMDKHSWLHFACHGSQNYTADPTTSAFHLHDNSMLMLSAIMRKQIKDGGLAFLSACETATGDDTLPDEAVHLAAGMMMAGYPSVIGTMWSIEDADAPLVAEKLYSYLLDGGEADETKAAHALHYAIQYLRDHQETVA
ncbi:hypothetical protein FRC12_021339 [Ceratobasidium sp. 428]|nr:hypothetical protein FRC12_021339 [Ceratobasidium sp. 428]